MPGVLPPQRRGNHFPASAMLTVAFWQLRRTWFLLLFIALGMTAAVVIACALPLLSDTMTTAGLRSTLRATPESADLQLNVGTTGLSTPIAQNIYDQFNPLFHRSLGNLIQPGEFTIASEDFSVFPPPINTNLTIYGTPMQQAAPHLGPLQGRLARITSNPASEIEVMMTPDTAQHLRIHVGSTFRLSLSYLVNKADTGVQQPGVGMPHSASITARLVGLFRVTPANAAYWHSNDFKTVTLFNANRVSDFFYQYAFLVPDTALLALYDHLGTLNHVDAVHTEFYDGYGFTWHYQLDASQITSSRLDALIDQLAGLQSTVDNSYGYLAWTVPNGLYRYLNHVELTSQLLSSNGDLSSLEEFRSRLSVARIPAGIFTILTLSLSLFFVSLLNALLVDRQAESIALLRSRGAGRLQIFGALFLQSIGLEIIALGIGLPLATCTVLFLAQRMLPGTDALNTITSHPVQATVGTIWYALAVALAALLTLGISLFFAARMDVLSLSRETTRSNRRPLWQRLNLDVLAGVVALVGYGITLYVTSIGTVLQGDAQVLLATPLSIIAPFFLMVGCLFLFLRIFPLLLQLGARLAGRGRGAVALLAFAQIARSPRLSLRISMLLALATAFTLFSLVFSATQEQHIQDIVSYSTGADFSAQLPSPQTTPAQTDSLTTLLASLPSATQIINRYQSIPGVLSASSGFSDQGVGGTADLPMDLHAVDPTSYGHTVIWPSQESFLAARPLLSKLVALRQSPDIINTFPATVPAIVDSTTISQLRLHVGSTFAINFQDIYPTDMQYVIVGVVDRIPTINPLLALENGSGQSMITGGVLVDYQTLLSTYRQQAKYDILDGSPTPPVLNQLWLHTRDDAVSLASVRTALENPKLGLAMLVDRRLLLTTLQSDPLFLVLDGVLILGTVIALLVALAGDILSSWLSARTRLMSFVTLQALGMTPAQVASVLTWEQVIVSVTGLLLGVGFGVLLIASVIPSLTFTDLNANLSSTQFFALQSALTIRIVVPPSLPFVLLIFVAIVVTTIAIMMRAVSRPALDRVLRLEAN